MFLDYYLILIIKIAGCLGQQYAFRSHSALANVMSSAEKVQFSTTTINEISCVRACSLSPNCHAAIFYHGNKTCFGLNTDDPFDVIISLPGAVFYKPTTPRAKAPCEPPWVYYDNSCYWMETTRKTLNNSFNFCDNLGAELLEISSSQENSFVASAASAAGLSTVWLSLNDKAVEGTHVWLSGEAVVYTEWGANEGGRSDEECVMMNTAAATWHDVLCGRSESFVCEKHIA